MSQWWKVKNFAHSMYVLCMCVCVWVSECLNNECVELDSGFWDKTHTHTHTSMKMMGKKRQQTQR